MQFTSATIALITAFAMIETAQAGAAAIIIANGIPHGRRSLPGRDISEHMQLWTRDGPLAQSLGACMGAAQEKMIITAAGGNNFRIDSVDGSIPQPCSIIADSYMSTEMTDGKLTKAGNGYVIAVLPKHLNDFNALAQAMDRKGTRGGAPKAGGL